MRSVLPWLGLVPAAWALLLIQLRRRAVVVTVDGDSMWPAFKPGDRVLVRRIGAGRLRRGQVIIVERPGEDGTWPAPPSGPVGRRQWVIKRVAAVPGEPRPGNCPPASADSPERLVPAGKLVLLGDNPAWSYDSREFGYFPSDRLLGVVVLRVSRGVVPGISA